MEVTGRAGRFLENVLGGIRSDSPRDAGPAECGTRRSRYRSLSPPSEPPWNEEGDAFVGFPLVNLAKRSFRISIVDLDSLTAEDAEEE